MHPRSYSQVQSQAEIITEEDLRLIQERESAIRQLEVGFTHEASVTPQLCVLAAKDASSTSCLVFFEFSLTSQT